MAVGVADRAKDQVAEKTGERKPARRPARSRKLAPAPGLQRPKLAIDRKALKKLNLVAVAYSHVEREWFPTEEAYHAEIEVEERAQQVVDALNRLGINAKGYAGDPYFLTNLLVDRPDLVLNLVDTLRGRDALQTSVPAALELAQIPYTGAGMQGLVIGNDRNLVKQLLISGRSQPRSSSTSRAAAPRSRLSLAFPLIAKLNESGGSVGIDNKAVKDTVKAAEKQVNTLIGAYRLPVIVERFIDGPELSVVVFDDGRTQHVFSGDKQFGSTTDGKYFFTSLESYESADAYAFKPVGEPLASEVARLARRSFELLRYKDYAKFDVRVDKESGIPYFTDANPNTAFGPHIGLPFTEILALYGVDFDTVLLSLLSKHAKRIR